MTALGVRSCLFALFVACSSGVSVPPDEPDSPPDTRPIQEPESTPEERPKRQGWYCFAMIHRDKGESAENISDCQRTIEECNYLRYEYERSDEFDVTTCARQPEAACFQVKHRPSGLIKDQCAANMAQCAMRHYILSKYPDEVELVSGCSRTG